MIEIVSEIVELEIGVEKLDIQKGWQRKYQSPNLNVGTRNRSTSRVTMNRDRMRCYECREYDHFAKECPNLVTDDPDGYESDRGALQLIIAEAEIHENLDGTRLNEE